MRGRGWDVTKMEGVAVHTCEDGEARSTDSVPRSDCFTQTAAAEESQDLGITQNKEIQRSLIMCVCVKRNQTVVTEDSQFCKRMAKQRKRNERRKAKKVVTKALQVNQDELWMD